MNNTCTCLNGWSGSSCHIPPGATVESDQGDSACGNWGVYGSMTLGASGYTPTCECNFGMKGERCELECTQSADCGQGSCDTSVGRCVCATRCYSDADCPWNTSCDISRLQCNNGWTGVKCGSALSSSCSADNECGVNGGKGEGGSCVDGACVCEKGFTGLRCEVPLVEEGESCDVTSDCASWDDICVSREKDEDRGCYPECETEFTGRACGVSGEACEADVECRTVCERGVCAGYDAPPDMSELELDEKLKEVLDGMLTPDGLSQLGAEELVDKTDGFLLWVASKGWKRMIKRYLTYKSATRIAPVGAVGSAATGSALPGILKSLSNAQARAAIRAAKLKLAKLGTKANILLFVLTVVSMVLDIDDAAGYNAQVPQGGVDLTMLKILQAFNNFPEIQEAGVHFPREYLPEMTVEWGRERGNEVLMDRTLDLTLDYLDRLVLNSNGERIIAAWPEVDTARSEPEPAAAAAVAAREGSVLWKLAGKNAEVYTQLTRWWWMVAVLGAVILLTLGLGLGLGLRKKGRRPKL